MEKKAGKKFCWILRCSTKTYHVPVLRKEAQELCLYILRLVFLASVIPSLSSFEREETVQLLYLKIYLTHSNLNLGLVWKYVTKHIIFFDLPSRTFSEVL